MKVKRPLYCDTDSIICENTGTLELDSYKLGAWDIEGQGDKLAIGGKKLYCLWKGRKAVKQASKGAKLKPADLLKIAQGKTVRWQSEAPNFKLTGDIEFTARNLQKR